jgi:hypothetical protein
MQTFKLNFYYDYYRQFFLNKMTTRPLKNKGNTIMRDYKPIYRKGSILSHLEAPKHWYEYDTRL